MADGIAQQFSLRMEVKSIITTPSGKMKLQEKGIYEISGLAWSGNGEIRTVEVSADGGNSWAEAEIQSGTGRLQPVRFRIPWRWSGQPATLQSRAIDAAGNTQPTREQALKGQSPLVIYHYNGIQSWQVEQTGRIKNVYA